jgi:HEAT repeat protein
VGVPWYEWWWANQWRFIRIPQRYQVATGTGQDKEVALEHIVKFLTSTLKEKYFDIRAASALALGKAGEADSIKNIRPLLKTKNDVIRESAILALAMLKDEKSIPMLVRILEDQRQTDSLRVHCALALGLLGSADAGPALLKTLETETNAKTRMTDEIRAAAALSLGLIQFKPAVTSLIKLLDSSDANPDLRALTATALGKFKASSLMLDAGEISISGQLLKALQTTQPPQVRRAALMALSYVWYEGLGDSLLDLYKVDPDPWVKGLSLLVLAEHIQNPNVKKEFQRRVRKLIEDPKGDPLYVRDFAAVAAGLSDDKEAIVPLRVLFQKSKKPETRAAAAVGLGFLKDFDSVPMILDGMRTAKTPFLKAFCCVAFALMEKPNKHVSAQLRAILANPKNAGTLRACASIALAKIRDFSAVNLLLDYMNRGDRRVRQLMVISVGYFRDLATYLPLKTLFESKKSENETKAIILVSLGYIVEKEHPPVLKTLFLHYNFLLPFQNLSRIFHLM